MGWSLANAETGIVRLFFANFWRVLLTVISAGQWVCVYWIALVFWHLHPPLWVHPLGIGAFYALNRIVVRRRKATPPRWSMRLYSAWAFTALFCLLFFATATVAWGVARGVLGVLVANAGTVGASHPLGSGIDNVFQWIVSGGMATIGLLFAYGYVFGQRELVVTRVTVSVRGLPPRPAPLRVVQISDIHVGPNLPPEALARLVARVNELDADLICITGDIVDSASVDCDRFFPTLAGLRAGEGVCTILGNHDHMAGADRVAAALRRWTAFRVLRDASVTLTVAGTALHVIGLDDRGRDWARGRRVDARLTELLEAAPAGVPTLLLSHRPDPFVQAAAAGVNLMLSGHTHGGQLALPWFGGRRRNLAEFITDFDRGLYVRDSSVLYVNSGLGVAGQPIRLFSPREITVIELQPA